MNLIISSDGENKYLLRLKNKIKTVDSYEIPEKGYLDAELIKAVDKFLKKNRINKLNVYKVIVKGLDNKTSSKQRIIRTFAEAMNS